MGSRGSVRPGAAGSDRLRTHGGAADSFAGLAQSHGADWLILQPLPVKGLSEADWLDFFGKVMDSTSLPVAIQNALDYLGVGLSVKGLMTLLKRHPNFTLLKGEGPLVTMAEVIQVTEKGGFRFSMGGADWN